MTVECQVVRFQKTSTGTNGTTQDVSLNFTPKAIIVFSCDLFSGADDTFNEGIYASYGFSDGTNHACWSIGSEDNQGTSDTGGSHRTDSVVAYQALTTPANTAVRASCSFITNAVRFTWDSNDGILTNYIYVVAFGGSDITNVKVNTVSIGTTGTGTADFTGLGFTPVAGESILFTLDNNTTTNNANESICSPSMGCAVSSTKRWALANTFEDARAASDTWRYFTSLRCLASLTDTTGALDYLADFNSWITDGFRLDIEDGSSSSTNKFSYMVIKGGKWDCGRDTTPTTATTDTVTVDSALATMKGVFCAHLSFGTEDSVGGVAELCMGAHDGTNSGWMGWIERTGKDPTVNISRHSANDRLLAAVVTDNTTNVPSMTMEGAFSSFGTNQFTISHSVAPGFAFPYGWWAVGQASSTLFERSISESSISVSDSNTRRLTGMRSLSESSISVSDARARLLLANRAISESSISVSDSNDRIKTLFTLIEEDPISVSDSLARILLANRLALGSDVGVSDAVARLRTALAPITEDSITVNDTGSGATFISNRIINENVDVSETLERLLSANRLLDEPSIDVSDVVGRELTAFRVLSEDLIDVSDELDRIITRVKSITEDEITVSDSLARLLTAFRELEEDIDVSDAIAVGGANTRTLTESAITVSDSLDRLRTAFSVIEEDPIDIDDALTRFSLQLRSISEPSISVSDSLVRFSLKLRTLTESAILVSDSLVRLAILVRIISEDSDVFDSLVRFASHFRTISESSISVSDSLVRILIANRIITESAIGVVDALEIPGSFSRSLSEPAISVSDLISRMTFQFRTISQSISVSDLLGFDETNTQSIIEAPISVSDSVTRRLSAFRIISESISISDLLGALIPIPVFAQYITDPGYTNPVRIRVTFKSKKDDTSADPSGDQVIYYRYDSYVAVDRPFNLSNFSIRLTQGEISTASMDIEDHKELVDVSKIKFKSIVEIEFKKELGREWERILTGVVRRFKTLRPKNRALTYRIVVLSKQVIYNERVINFKRAAKRSGIESTDALTTDSQMEANRLFKEIHTATNIFPRKRSPTIQQTGDFDLETGSISDDVNDFITEISTGLTTANEGLNAIVEGTGAIYGSDEFGNPYLRYPTEKHSGIVITDNPADDDSALNTSVNMDAFEFEDIIDTTEGFANRLYVLNSKDTKVMEGASSNEASGFTTLTTRWIAQSFIATDNNITSAAFILSKVGNPVSASGVIKGLLRGSNTDSTGTYPTGPTLATFEIALSSLTNAKDTIFVNDIKTKDGTVIIGSRYWWVLQGEDLFDDSNTAKWHHDNDFATSGRPISATLPNVDIDPTTPGLQRNWIISNHGPEYTYSTFSSVNHILTQSDNESIQENGLIEAIVNLPAFSDDATFQKVLVKLLKYSAKVKRIYEYARVTIPTNRLFRPGELVTVVDSKANLDKEKVLNAEIVEVSYNFDVGTNALGCKYVDIRLVGFVDTVVDNYLENREC